MANLGARDEFEAMEEDTMRWATQWDEVDDMIYAAARREYIQRARVRREKKKLVQKLARGGRRRKKRRSHPALHQKILDDYFGTPAILKDRVVHEEKEPDISLEDFHRRFRMGPILFLKLLHEISDPVIGHPAFNKGKDVTGEEGSSALQKLVAVFRMLAYGVAFDAVHEYTGVTRTVARECLYAFCDWIDAHHGGTYLGVWTPEAIKTEMDINAARGFKGMLGSIDCTHWHWKNCPYPWQGQFHDRNGHRSVIAEAIAGHDLYFWHVFLGCPGSLNDLTVLGISSLASTYMESSAATVKFIVGGVEYEGAYFLADGIYPSYAYLMKTIPGPRTEKEKHFAKKQEGVRKDVERAFGRLLSKWHILNVAARSWFLENVKKIWRACFILHNMTIRENDGSGFSADKARVRAKQQEIEQERLRNRAPCTWSVEEDVGQGEASLQVVVSRIDEQSGGMAMGIDESEWAAVLDRLGRMQDVGVNMELTDKTVERLWDMKGDGVKTRHC